MNASSKTFSRASLVFLFLLPFAIFWENFVPGRLVMTSDANIAGFIQSHEMLGEGWYAHWSPGWWLGLPGGTPSFRIETLLVWLLPPVVYAKISIPLFLAVGGVTAFLLGRALGFADFVSLIFALGWELVGSSLTDIPGGHHSRQLMFGVAPLMFLGLWMATKDRPYCGVVLASVAVATMVGALADSGAFFALTGVAFFIWLNRNKLGSPRFWKQAVLGTAVTILLCSQIALSFIPSLTSGLKSQDLPGTGPASSEQNWEWHTQWSFAPEEVLELFAPGFFGWQTGDALDAYWGRVGRSAGWEKTHQGFRNFRIDNPTTGTAVTALALVGLCVSWRRRRLPGVSPDEELCRLGKFFTWLGVVTLLISFGKYLPGYRLIFETVPGFQAWRNPNKFFFLTSFCAVYLAGLGAQAIYNALTGSGTEDAGRWVRSVAKGWWAVAGALLVGSFLVVVFRRDLYLQVADEGLSPEQTASIVAGMLESMLHGAFFWACWGGLALAALKWPPRRIITGAVWVTLSIAEMWGVASNYISYFDYRQMLAPNPMLGRVIEEQQKDVFRFKMIVTDQLLNSFYFFQIPYHRIHSIDIPASSRTPDDYDRYFREMQADPVKMWELGNVRYVLAQSPVAEQILGAVGTNRLQSVVDYMVNPVGSGYTISEAPPNTPGSYYRLLGVKNPMARAEVIPQIRVVSDPNELFAVLKNDKTDLRSTMLVLASSGVDVPAGRTPAKKMGAKIREYSANRIVVDAHADQPAYLLLNDKYDPDWKVSVNGKPGRIFRANFIVRGVEIPAGNSEVVFTYELDSRVLYFTIAAWAVVILGGGAFCLFIGRVKR